MDFSKINRSNLITISIYIIGFSIGTISHSIDIVLMGFLGYTFAPFILNVFWTSLVFFDPLTILLLFLKFRPAIWLATITMILDISINLIYGLYSSKYLILLGLTTQIPFSIFVFITANRLYESYSIKDFLAKK
ncbi:hypothetical protein EHR08_19515 [Leptospira bandrabouensis]|uniref:DUF2569 family protein n=1 Tax=Leptospira bandrabouensis TaxID=2484903 RepID=A0A6H3NML6_9LEPT|nr:hypothetical protein EHR08_19515 [Leptospira bandrabouensis]